MGLHRHYDKTKDERGAINIAYIKKELSLLGFSFSSKNIKERNTIEKGRKLGILHNACKVVDTLKGMNKISKN